jgi:hypothetical protein
MKRKRKKEKEKDRKRETRETRDMTVKDTESQNSPSFLPPQKCR